MTEAVANDTPTWLTDACAYIETNAAALTSIGDVATAVSMDPVELVEEFRRQLGFTPQDFLDDVLFGADQ